MLLHLGFYYILESVIRQHENKIRIFRFELVFYRKNSFDAPDSYKQEWTCFSGCSSKEV